MEYMQDHDLYPDFNNLKQGENKPKQNKSPSISQDAVHEIISYQADLLKQKEMPDSREELRQSEAIIVAVEKARKFDQLKKKKPELFSNLQN